MKIILMGPPGSGKGTQAQLICNNFKIPKISVGDILRQNNKKHIINIMKKGNLIPDELVINIIKNKIKEKIYHKGFLLDGFPRTKKQAEFLKNIDINYIIIISVKDDILIERLSGRLIHKNSGRLYHKIYNPPKIEGLDDITKERLEHREDDNINTIKKRLKNYNKNIKPLIQYFVKSKKIFSKIHIIDGSLSIEKIKISIFNKITK